MTVLSVSQHFLFVQLRLVSWPVSSLLFIQPSRYRILFTCARNNLLFSFGVLEFSIFYIFGFVRIYFQIKLWSFSMRCWSPKFDYGMRISYLILFRQTWSQLTFLSNSFVIIIHFFREDVTNFWFSPSYGNTDFLGQSDVFIIQLSVLYYLN